MVVTVIPYVGPHLDVGKDRIKFQINNMGQVVVDSEVMALSSHENKYAVTVKKAKVNKTQLIAKANV
ncbi:hypothetical protein UB51_08420 [Paenibacillus sp. IHBB 10380]|nr:hypothetical protein UB51_08420 [Paenibacillus sp. IHBB 10380]